MKRLFKLTLTVLFLALLSLSLPSVAGRKGSTGEKNPDVYGEVYLETPHIIWYDDGTTAYSQSYHSFFICNYSGEDSYSYDYEFQHPLLEYHPEKPEGQRLGAWITEDKDVGAGSVATYSQKGKNNWPHYLAKHGDFQYLYLPEYNLDDREWYAISAYTRLTIRRQRGGIPDNWKVEAVLSFQYREPND